MNRNALKHHVNINIQYHGKSGVRSFTAQTSHLRMTANVFSEKETNTSIAQKEQDRIKAESSIHTGTYEAHDSLLKTLEEEHETLHCLEPKGEVLAVIEQMQKVSLLYWKLGVLDEAQSLQEEVLKRQMKYHVTTIHGNDQSSDGKMGIDHLPQHMDIAQTLHTIGSIQARLDEPHEAKKWLTSALKMKEHLLYQIQDYEYHFEIGKTYNSLALIEIQFNDIDSTGADTMDIIHTFQNAEKHYIYHGEKKEEDENQESNKQISSNDEMENHPHLASIYENMALLYRKHGDYEQSLLKYKEALRIHLFWISTNEIETNGDAHTVNLSLDIGDCHKALDEYEEGLEQYKEALRLHLIVIRKERQKQIQAKQSSSTIGDDSDDSSTDAFEVLDPTDETLQSPMEAVIRDNIGHMHAQLDNYKDSLMEYQSSLRIKKSIDETNPEVAKTLNAIGALKATNDEYDGALAYFKEALYIFKMHSNSIYGLGEDADENIVQTKKNIEIVNTQMRSGGFGSRRR